MSDLNLDFLRTTKDVQRSSDFKTNVREDIVSDCISENVFDTTSNRIIYNTPSTKFTKFVESVPRQTNMRDSIRKFSRKKIQHLRNNRRLETDNEYKSNKTVRWRRNSGNSVIYDRYTLLRKFKFYNLILKRNAKGRIVKCIRKTRIEPKRFDDCNEQRHSYHLTNAAYACKKNLKSTTTAIMRDNQEHIRRVETAKDDVGNIQGLTIPVDGPDEKLDNKDLNRDISIKYDWIGLENNGELNNGEMPRNNHTIDCKFVGRTKTTCRKVFHECVDFDSLLATSSLKMDVDESARSEDNDSPVEMTHSSWRRSVSFTDKCDKDFDNELLLAQKIVSDDSAKSENWYDDWHETLESMCYKYHDTSDVYATISKDTSINNSCSEEEDMKVMNKMKSIITYKEEDKDVWSSVQVDRKFVKSENDNVQDTKNNKTDNTVHLMRTDTDNEAIDLEYESDKRENVPQKITTTLIKTTNENHTGKLVWGSCSGWWPALVVDAEHVGMAPCSGKLWVFWIGEERISSLTGKTQIQPFSNNLEHRLKEPSRKRSRAIDATMQILRQRFCTLTKPYYQWIQRNVTEIEMDDLTFYPYPKNIQESLDTLKETNIKATENNLLNQRRLPKATLKRKRVTKQHKDTNTSWKKIDDERLPWQDQNPGEIVWAKITGQRWWPGMIIDYRDCYIKKPRFDFQWVIWYDDYTVSEVHRVNIWKFDKGIEKMPDLIKNTVTKRYLESVLKASKDYCARLGCSTDNWTLDNVFEYFENKNNMHIPSKKMQVSDSNKIYDKYSDTIIEKIKKMKPKPNVDEERTRDIKMSYALRRVISGKCAVEKLCLKCLSFSKGRMEEHPFFIGSLCKECLDVFKPRMSVYGKDGKCLYCTVCASSGSVLICDADNCQRVYCTACLKFLVCPKSYDEILTEDPWKCFLCTDKSKQSANMILHPRLLDQKKKPSKMFRTESNPASGDADLLKHKEKRPIRVLSLFDGLSTDVENIQGLTIPANSPDEKLDDKHLNRDITRIKYDWIGLEKNGELNNGEMSPQNNHTIDCKFVGRTETTCRKVFHECVDFDSLLATSSLKMDVDENGRSEDNDSPVEMTHSSWRRSVSFTDKCDKDIDNELLLAQKIVSDDSAKGENWYDDERETLKRTCYKYHDRSDVQAIISKDTSVNNWCLDEEDLKYTNDQMKRITYKKKCKDIWSSVQVDSKFVKSGNDNVQGTKSNKTDNTVHLMRKDTYNEAINLEYESDKKENVPQEVTTTLKKTTKENRTGKLVWGSCSGWWPALVVDAEHIGMAPCSGKLWVFWIGEKKISSLTEKTQIQPFSNNLEHRLKEPSRKRSRAIDATMQILRQRFCTLTKPYYQWIQRNVTEIEMDDLTFYPYPKNIQESLDTLKETNIKATENNLLNQRRLPEGTPIEKQIIEQHKSANTSWPKIDDERLLFQDQNPGEIAWVKIPAQRWWPAMIIDYRDCYLKKPRLDCQWVMWYGDYKVLEVHHLQFLKFYKGLEKMHDLIKNTVTKLYLDSVLQASKDYCARLGCSTDNWTLDNVFEYFSNKSNIYVPCKKLQVSDSDKYSDIIVKNINEFKLKTNVDAERTSDIKTSDALCRVISGECAVEKLCLKCLSFPKGRMEEHPFFIGSLCKQCSDIFKPCMFVYGEDDKCFYCTVCASAGIVVICDADNCQRVYCTACLKFLVCPKSYDEILLEDPWHCFLCRDESKQPDNMVLRPRLDWKEKFSRMFRTVSNPASDVAVLLKCNKKRPIRVLSLFDGLSTGLLVLLNLGIVVDVYYASEIDTDVMMISSVHFGDRITQLGDVRNITKEKIQEIAPIDLLIGGSPCNDLSLANPVRKSLQGPKGKGILFFEYTRIKDLVMKANEGRHMFWLYENVASMRSKYRLEINKHFGQEPDVIDAADFSPQRRLRLYWHNLPFDPNMPLFQKRQNVQGKLTPNLNRKVLCKKLRTVTTSSNSLLQTLGKNKVKPIMMNGASHNLWITEIEEILGFPRHYTDVKNFLATKRQKFLGKSWSVQTLTAILRPLCSYFKCNEDKTSS